MYKKIVKISTVILASLLTLSTPLTYADQVEKGIDVKVSIPATMVEATIPLVLASAIDPNQEYENSFVSANYKLINNTNAPIKIFMRLVPNGDNVPNITSPDKHENWQRLTKKQSSEDIAIGIEDLWFNGDEEYIIINPSLKSKSEQVYELQTRHGMSFEKGTEFKYRIETIIELT